MRLVGRHSVQMGKRICPKGHDIYCYYNTNNILRKAQSRYDSRFGEFKYDTASSSHLSYYPPPIKPPSLLQPQPLSHTQTTDAPSSTFPQ
jgi:hypothetical protein